MLGTPLMRPYNPHALSDRPLGSWWCSLLVVLAACRAVCGGPGSAGDALVGDGVREKGKKKAPGPRSSGGEASFMLSTLAFFSIVA